MTPGPVPASLTIGTRGSPLALAQTRLVVDLLARAGVGPRAEVVAIETRGDRTQASGEPLPEIGGKGLFTAELEQALRAGEVDAAVHSLKDLPTEEAPGLVLGAVCAREDVRDCLVSADGATLLGLRAGATLGTSSLRRAAQLRMLRGELRIESVRGNVGTRVRKVRDGELDAVVVAASGIHRLGLEGEVAEWFPADVLLPAPGQGALAVQCRADDETTLSALAAVDDPSSRATTTAERAFLADLEAGCSAPVATYARPSSRTNTPSESLLHAVVGDELEVEMDALVASLDGRRVVRVAGRGHPMEIGSRLAREARDAGAAEILAEIRG